jgi:hypothetical protein
MIHDFQENLVFSKGEVLSTDTETIKGMIPGCVSCEPTLEAADRNGIDFVATLRRGARIYIDSKTRKPGCSKFWKMTDGKKEPELALEKWSVLPGGKYRVKNGKVGWTLCEQKQTDMIFFSYPPEDCRTVFLLPFQLLRIAFRKHLPEWQDRFKVDVQDSGTWQSEAVFVPVGCVMDAIRKVSQSTVVKTVGGISLQYEFAF